ncbi:MAG: LapA family protein [Lactobacillus sp.]|jgi:uncharacterized integral membrane protein|nr:LapA family protein [Lactobacillus sp.]
MNLIRMVVLIFVLLVLLVFCFNNNDLVTLNLWPFFGEDDVVEVTLSVVIFFLSAFSFIFGMFFVWVSYAPALRSQKYQNKKLIKANSKMAAQVVDLKEDLNTLKGDGEEPKKPFGGLFKKNKKTAEKTVEE